MRRRDAAGRQAPAGRGAAGWPHSSCSATRAATEVLLSWLRRAVIIMSTVVVNVVMILPFATSRTSVERWRRKGNYGLSRLVSLEIDRMEAASNPIISK